MINKKPLVSVILTTYNRFDLFLQAYQAILGQTYKKLEIIIIDDCSTEKDYEKNLLEILDDRTIYIRHDINKGLASARNTGIKKSRGSFISFCDDDDIWMSKKIELQLRAYFNSPAHVGVITSASKILKDKNSFLRKVKTNGWFYKKMIGAKQPLGNGSTLLFTKKCIDSVGLFDVRYKRGIDGEYLYRVSLRYKVISVNIPLVSYNLNSSVRRITDNKQSQSIKKDIISLVRSLRYDLQINGILNIQVFLLYIRLIKRLFKIKKFWLIHVLTIGIKK